MAVGNQHPVDLAQDPVRFVGELKHMWHDDEIQGLCPKRQFVEPRQQAAMQAPFGRGGCGRGKAGQLDKRRVARRCRIDI